MSFTIGRNIVAIAVLLVTSVMQAVIAERHIMIAQTLHPSKKFRALPIASDRPETYTIQLNIDMKMEVCAD